MPIALRKDATSIRGGGENDARSSSLGNNSAAAAWCRLGRGHDDQMSCVAGSIKRAPFAIKNCAKLMCPIMKHFSRKAVPFWVPQARLHELGRDNLYQMFTCSSRARESKRPLADNASGIKNVGWRHGQVYT